MTSAHAEHEPPAPGLSARLMALARLIQVGMARGGRDGFGRKLLSDAEDVLGRAGGRLRLSGDHTVVVLAGGTGSGKSSLFNKLAGADFSVVGVTRPVTREPHACIWGPDGAGPLLEWLGVPRRNRYSRASALDQGEDDLTGMVLVDLPDHDSVLTRATGIADRLVGQADMLVWVLDPQKYADAAVHRRYLAPLAGHGDVLAVVLNQADLLEGDQVDDCVSDLRRLLESEDLHDVPILVTSAVTGTGLDDLRKLLIHAVSGRRAAVTRISADVDRIARRFARFSADPGGSASGRIPPASEQRLAEAFAQAGGVGAVIEMLRSARELRAAGYAGWPVASLVRRLTRGGPNRRLRVGALWEQLRSVTAGPSGSQQAEIDNALTGLADEVAEPLPKPWKQFASAAIRSRAEQIAVALGTAMRETLPAESDVAWWWRLAGAWQGVLLGTAIVGLAWAGAVLAFGVMRAGGHPPALLANAASLPWIAAATAAVLLLGWLSASVSMTWARTETEREAATVDAEMRNRIAAVVHEMVIMPTEQEFAEFKRFRDELRIASGG